MNFKASIAAALAFFTGLTFVANGSIIAGSVLLPDVGPGTGRLLVPGKAWDCGMPGGIPMPEYGVPVFEATLKLDQVYDLGKTQYGPRRAYVTQQGAITGERFQGTVMSGGLDFELNFENGVREVEELFVIRATNGAYLFVRIAGTAADPQDVRIVPDFEAPNDSAYAWLNSNQFVGRRVLNLEAKTLKLSFYDMSKAQVSFNGAGAVIVKKPDGFKDQPWDYRRPGPGEHRGEQLITENVTLGGGQRVGAAKNRNRNIIPITGGTITGKITGKVLAGGADYQNLSNPATIDARYFWQTSDGEVIIVRNAGPFSSLAPTFEVRVDSSYAWLNDGKYLSSSPGMGAGGVSLTFFKSAE